MIWLLVIVLALTLLVAFTSCADDIVGPKIQDKEKDGKEDGTGEDPNDGGGTIVGNLIIWPDSSKNGWI